MAGYAPPSFAMASNESHLRAGQPEFNRIEEVMADWVHTMGTSWEGKQFSRSPNYGYIVRATLVRRAHRVRYVFWYAADGTVLIASE